MVLDKYRRYRCIVLYPGLNRFVSSTGASQSSACILYFLAPYTSQYSSTFPMVMRASGGDAPFCAPSILLSVGYVECVMDR